MFKYYDLHGISDITNFLNSLQRRKREKNLPEEVACEVFAHGKWQGIDIDLALKMPRTRTKRCPECHGQVRAHSAGSNGMKAHIEHYERHKGCARGDCFDGNSRRHPAAVR